MACLDAAIALSTEEAVSPAVRQPGSGQQGGEVTNPAAAARTVASLGPVFFSLSLCSSASPLRPPTFPGTGISSKKGATALGQQDFNSLCRMLAAICNGIVRQPYRNRTVENIASLHGILTMYIVLCSFRVIFG